MVVMGTEVPVTEVCAHSDASEAEPVVGAGVSGAVLEGCGGRLTATGYCPIVDGRPAD